jgi:hypothetical protein
MMKCRNCGNGVTSDGHGDLIHVDDEGKPGAYGCDPKNKGKAYPVAE